MAFTLPPPLPTPYTNTVNDVHNNDRLDPVPKGMGGSFVQDLRKLRAVHPAPIGKAAPAPKGAKLMALGAALKPKIVAKAPKLPAMPMKKF